MWTRQRTEIHSHTNKHTHCPYDGGSSEWEKPVLLIQPQQGIKSTLCLCVMQGLAGLDRSLDTMGPISQSPLSNPSCLCPPSAKHDPCFIDFH